MRHGERSTQVFNAAFAQAGDLSVWQTLQAFGIFNAPVVAGVMKWNVWLRTLTSAIVCSIFGMWQAMHSLPGLLGLWWVCSSTVAARGPLGEFGP